MRTHTGVEADDLRLLPVDGLHDLDLTVRPDGLRGRGIGVEIGVGECRHQRRLADAGLADDHNSARHAESFEQNFFEVSNIQTKCGLFVPRSAPLHTTPRTTPSHAVSRTRCTRSSSDTSATVSGTAKSADTSATVSGTAKSVDTSATVSGTAKCLQIKVWYFTSSRACRVRHPSCGACRACPRAPCRTCRGRDASVRGCGVSVVLSLGHRRFVGVCLCGVMCLVSVVCVIRSMPCQCLLVLFTGERERKRVCVCDSQYALPMLACALY